MKSFGHSLIQKSFWLYLFAYLMAPIGYFIRIVISNTISIEEVGVLYSVMGFMIIVGTYHDLGFSEALNYFIPKFIVSGEKFRTKTLILGTLAIQVVTSILITILMRHASDWLAMYHFHDVQSASVIKYFCIYFVINNFYNMMQNIYNAYQDVFRARLIEFLKILSVLIFCIIIRFGHFANITNYSLAWIGGSIFGLVICTVFFVVKYWHIMSEGGMIYDPKMNSDYIKYALRVLLGLNAGMLMGQIDQQMIINLIGPESAGYYTNYLSLFNIRSILIGAFFGFLFPLISNLHASGDKDKIRSIQNIIYTYFTVFGMMLSVLFVVLGEKIATVLFGDKFLFSGQLLMVTGFFVVVTNMIDISFGILAGIGKIKQRVLILRIGAIINVIANFFAISARGVRGAIFATIVSWIFIAIGSTIQVYRDYPFAVSRKIIIKNLIGFLIFGFILSHFRDSIFLFSDTRVKDLILICAVGLSAVAVVFALNFKQFVMVKNMLLDNFKQTGK